MVTQIKLLSNYTFGGMRFFSQEEFENFVYALRPLTEEKRDQISNWSQSNKIQTSYVFAQDGLSTTETKIFDSQETYESWLALKENIDSSEFRKAGWTLVKTTLTSLY